MHQRIIGIDLAIRGRQVAQIFDGGVPVGKPLRFGLDAEALERFVARVKKGVAPQTPIRAVMEPTGMAWFPVATWLHDAGIEVIRVKGQRVKALRRYLSEHAKTDLADAHLLAAIPHFGGRAFNPVHIPTPSRHALQRLSKQRHRYREQICAARRRLLDLIRWAAPALEPVLPDLTSRLGLALLGDYFNPHRVLAARRDILRCFIARHAAGSHPRSGHFVEELIDGLREAARRTLALHRGWVDFEALQFEIAQEIELLRMLQRQTEALERRIQSLYREHDPEGLLQTIPGIGPHIAPVLLAILGDVRRFPNQRQLRGFCGLFPTCSASGGVEKPGQRLIKGGNDRIKRALYLAADTARRIDPQLAELYWRLMVRRGHHHKQALCAVANRLVNRIYRVLKTGRPYELRAPDGRPIDLAEAKQIVRERYSVPLEIRMTRRRHREPVAEDA